MLTVRVNNSVTRYSNNDSGYKGIAKHHSGKWEAFVSILQRSGYKKIYVGLYSTVEEAVEARTEFIINLL